MDQHGGHVRVCIRNAEPADAESILSLCAAVRLNSYAPFFAESDNAAEFASSQAVTPEAIGRLAASMRDNAARRRIVAEAAGEIVGYIAWTNRASSSHITYLFVSDAYRGTGVAQRLMEAFLERAGADTITLFVLQANEHAIRFYQRYGFTATGQGEPYFGLPRLEMRLLTKNNK